MRHGVCPARAGEQFGMKLEALYVLLFTRGQRGLVSESVWVGGQVSGPWVTVSQCVPRQLKNER